MLVQTLVIAATSSAYMMLLALGFTLIFGLMRIVNFAHGEFVMLGAYAVYVLTVPCGLNYFVAIPLAGLFAGLCGVVAERLIFRPFLGDELGAMITSLALAIILQGAVMIVFTVDQLSVPRPISGVLHFGSIYLPNDQIFVAGSSFLVVIAFHFLVHHTRLGLALRAVAQDTEIARAYGMAPSVILPLAFGIGCVLAGLAGALTVPLYAVNPFMGEAALLKAFIVVVLGGLGSLPGAMIAAVILGTTDAVISVWFSATMATLVSFVLVVIILIVKPSGLWGRA
ncbi:MAG: branched-chain amino acid ABC transporter permease [Xanthobacteraceae bacterium]|nr:branched-chain amino acid ABC transporter permease [Xanthobacteraceae bacterium]